MARAVKRNYKKEYKDHQSSVKEKKNRAKRNKARRRAVRKGKVKKGDGNDLHHPNGVDSTIVVVMTASKNRGKKEKSRKKGSKRKKK